MFGYALASKVMHRQLAGVDRHVSAAWAPCDADALNKAAKTCLSTPIRFAYHYLLFILNPNTILINPSQQCLLPLPPHRLRCLVHHLPPRLLHQSPQLVVNEFCLHVRSLVCWRVKCCKSTVATCFATSFPTSRLRTRPRPVA